MKTLDLVLELPDGVAHAHSQGAARDQELHVLVHNLPQQRAQLQVGPAQCVACDV